MQDALEEHCRNLKSASHPIFWLSEQAKVEMPLCARNSPEVFVMFGGGTRKFLGMCSSPSYSIMPANCTCGASREPQGALQGMLAACWAAAVRSKFAEAQITSG